MDYMMHVVCWCTTVRVVVRVFTRELGLRLARPNKSRLLRRYLLYARTILEIISVLSHNVQFIYKYIKTSIHLPRLLSLIL